MANLNKVISIGFNDIPTTQIGEYAFNGIESEIRSAIRAGIVWTDEETHPLHSALLGGQLICAELLLAAGAPVNSYSLYLAHRFNPNIFRKLFMNSKYTSLLGKDESSKNLVDACNNGSLDLVEFFLKNKANVNDVSYGY